AYEDRVDFYIVYTREAHPVGSASPYSDDEWDPWINKVTGVRLGEPETIAARRERARWSGSDLELPVTILVDDDGDTMWNGWGRAPSAAFVLDAEGRVILSQPWVDPGGLREALESLLATGD
ncbi:MAG: hypothetical protein AAGD38_04735, partial [Acidobacteriota bacterium]